MLSLNLFKHFGYSLQFTMEFCLKLEINSKCTGAKLMFELPSFSNVQLVLRSLMFINFFENIILLNIFGFYHGLMLV